MAAGSHVQIHAFSTPKRQAQEESVGAPTFKVLL
jgi:hypothetical protein